MNGMGNHRLVSGHGDSVACFTCRLSSLSYCFTAGLQAHFSLFFSFLLNALPRKWKLQLALMDIPEPLDFMDIENVFRNFLLGDHTLCSFVHILSELCSRQISLGWGVKKRRFQERHKTQEKGVLIHFHLCSYFLAKHLSFSSLIPPKNVSNSWFPFVGSIKLLLSLKVFKHWLTKGQEILTLNEETTWPTCGLEGFTIWNLR